VSNRYTIAVPRSADADAVFRGIVRVESVALSRRANSISYCNTCIATTCWSLAKNCIMLPAITLDMYMYKKKSLGCCKHSRKVLSADTRLLHKMKGLLTHSLDGTSLPCNISSLGAVRDKMVCPMIGTGKTSYYVSSSPNEVGT